ncbi:DNA uptake protein ComE-like DNA-binding protein [Tenacibaculum sp. 190524A02b]|uniref:helix-hairpin-helix domain-containing protein n=1 Tax=Tenacibaculum vairaonense TaxID=3137860 RepID=UPI0032B209E4
MKIFKPHFWYTKSQRNGVFFLGTIIVFLQAIYMFVDFSNEPEVDTAEESHYIAIVDSLKKNKKRSGKFVIKPFNPNYISDFKGYKLGMNVDQIDRLHIHRKRNKYINSVEDFQRVTGVSDSLLNIISPYFKFPDWVVERNRKRNKVRKNKKIKSIEYKEGKRKVLKDINSVSSYDLSQELDLDIELANRIIKYREKIKGYTFESQLGEVFGMTKKQSNEILTVFKILQKPKINRLNVNTVSFKQLLKIPYVDYELCKSILDYKEEVAEIQDISEIKNITGFPMSKYDRIVLYLEAK